MNLNERLAAPPTPQPPRTPGTVTHLPTPEPVGDVLNITDPDKYAAKALETAHTELASMGQNTGRNSALNIQAVKLGHLQAAQLLTEAQIKDTLLDACGRNGLLDEDGQSACEDTIDSGLRKGTREPLNWTHTPATDKTPAVRPFNSANVPAPTGPPLERTSWWPQNLRAILAGEADPEPSPTQLVRTDGHALFYPGKVNGLIGESESGKTWVALVAVAQALNRGDSVLYLDFEDTAVGIIDRLRALGVHDRNLNARQFTYISPDETLSIPAERDLSEVIIHARPALVIVDGINAAMTLLGLELTSNTDATSFSLRVLRPLKNTGACVITIDHVTKSKEGRGSYAIGAQAKRADVDGCLISVEVGQPFGRGQTGRLKLTVSKDRPGHVRAVSAGAKNAGEAVLHSASDGTINAAIQAPDLRPADERGPFRPTVLMQRVSEFLQAQSEGVTRTTIKNSVSGNNETVLKAIDVLVREGFAQVVSGGGVTSTRPYSEQNDPLSVPDRPASQDRPFPSLGTGPVSVPPSPLPTGGRGTPPENVPPALDDETDLRWDQR